MSLIVAAVVLQLFTSTFSAEDVGTNKTKRTVAGQVPNYGESRPVVLYAENPTPQGGLYKPIFEPDLDKQIAAQQVLYEYQQTPTNAVSNVHVNQYYQPLNKQGSTAAENTGPSQFSGSETIVNPVQHSTVIRHGPSYQQVRYHPQHVQYYPQTHPQHVQTHQYIPGKLVYLNGKITYPNPVQSYQKNPTTYVHPYQKMISSYRPIGYNKFTAPQQIQQITKPMYSPPVVEEQKTEEKAEDDDSNVKEADEVEEKEEDEDKASYEEEDDDDGSYFSRYSSFDDDDDDHDHSAYRHNHDYDEDDDNERGSSKTVPKKHLKKPQKYKSKNYKYSENYSRSSKYDKPMKKGKKGSKGPKMQYQTTRYSKRSHSRPRIDNLEGKQSMNVPVVHKEKIFKEKWYVTKSTDDSIAQ